jgi:Glu-tRNA(Gln) amidotransferase subunit E-like FAD-binding protein
MLMEVATGISIVSVGINLAKLISDMEKYADKKFEKILKELRNYKIDPENIVDILSAIINSQGCEQIEVTRLLGIFEKRKLVIKNHFSRLG